MHPGAFVDSDIQIQRIGLVAKAAGATNIATRTAFKAAGAEIVVLA